MRAAISTDGSYVSPHFGRCPSFTLIDLENGKMTNRTEVQNPGHTPGFIPQFLHEKGVGLIVSGGMGARAADLFRQYEIQFITGVEGKVDEAIHKLEQGVLEGGESLCQPGAGRGYGIEKDECDHGDGHEHDHVQG